MYLIDKYNSLDDYQKNEIVKIYGSADRVDYLIRDTRPISDIKGSIRWTLIKRILEFIEINKRDNKINNILK